MPDFKNEVLTGKISRIQRFSTQDGPGIRTTLFLKGCTLSCRWCHNPETITSTPELIWFEDKCRNCGRCVDACAHGAHVENPISGRHEFYRERCTLSGLCLKACPYEALDISLKEMSVAEVLNIILKDRSFYDHSGGGLTLSGGEPLLQLEFIKAVLKAAESERIHTTVDTALYVPWSGIEALLDMVNLWMVDVKIIDSGLHKLYTGSPNELILENLKKLSSKASALILRIPVIPGVNSDHHQIVKTAEFVKALPQVEYVELLPYHAMGVDKAIAAGLESYVERFKTPGCDILNAWVDELKKRTVSVRLSGDTV